MNIKGKMMCSVMKMVKAAFTLSSFASAGKR